MKTNRRKFIKQMGMSALGAGIATSLPWNLNAETVSKSSYEISLAQFSLASEFFSGKHNTLEFPARAKNEFGVNIVEYVSMFFADKAQDMTFLN